MKIEFDNAVLTKLADFSNADLVLDFDNTVGENGRPVEGCSIGTRYRLVAIDKGTVPDIFEVVIETNFAPLYFKKYGEMFLETEMTLSQSPDKRYQLKSSGGVIDSNVELVDYRTVK